MQPPGGVDDRHVTALAHTLLDSLAGDRDRVMAVAACVDRNLDLAAELLELVDRGRALQVAGDEERPVLFLAKEERQLCRRGRLARALQPGEQDHRRGAAGECEPGGAGAHQLCQLLVHDLHDLLPGREALQHVLPERPLAHLSDELPDDVEVDVGLEQGEADLAHRA